MIAGIFSAGLLGLRAPFEQTREPLYSQQQIFSLALAVQFSVASIAKTRETVTITVYSNRN